MKRDEIVKFVNSNGLANIADTVFAFKEDNKPEKCTRVGYDLHTCSCRKCIELDIRREE